jgi:hypothetical protein
VIFLQDYKAKHEVLGEDDMENSVELAKVCIVGGRDARVELRNLTVRPTRRRGAGDQDRAGSGRGGTDYITFLAPEETQSTNIFLLA